MMSKNSFWANMRENLKRRNWIAVIYSIAFLLAFPIGLTLWITSAESYKEWLTPTEWKKEMIIVLSEYLSINGMMTMSVTILAVICAIQGFSYLFRRQKMDMYMSVPVSKERRFAVIYLNGILLYAMPYLVSLLISLVIGAANGIVTVEVVKCMLYSYIAYLVYYMAIYNITIIAVMLTGNLLVSLCATGVFLFYEIIIKAIISVLCTTFFNTYSYYSSDWKVYVSPFIMLFQDSVEGIFASALTVEEVAVPYLISQTGMTILKILVIAIATGIIGYLLYAFRPAESCNKAIAFGKTKSVIKVAIMVPISLLAGVLFYSITDGNIAMTVLGFVIGIVLSHSIMEIIFAFDLKAALKHLPSGAVGAAIVFAVFFVFKFDITGYDSWVPNPEKVESIAIDIPVFEYGDCYDFDNGDWISTSEYAMDHMEFTDTESICALMESVVTDEVEEGEENIFWCTIKYRMKNGKEKYREVLISYDKYVEELDAILTSKEYQEGTYQILDEELSSIVKLKNIYFSNGVWDKKVDADDLEMVFENYKEDFAFYNLECRAEKYPIGVIYMEFEKPNDLSRNTYSYAMPVYDTFTKTKEYADKNGYLEDWRLKSENISEITINHWDENTYETEEKNFTDKAEIEELIPAIIPGEIANYRYYVGEADYSYDAYVSFSANTEDNWSEYGGSYFQVDATLLPEYAK